MKFSVFILTVLTLYQTGGTTAERKTKGEQAIPSVIRAYGQTLEKFYINRTFEFDDIKLQRSVQLPTQLALKSVADDLLFSKKRIERFCNVTRDTRSINENDSTSFLTDMGNFLTQMKQSIPFDFIIADNLQSETVVRITIDVTNENFVLTSKLIGEWDGQAPTISTIIQNVRRSLPSNVDASSKNYRFDSVAPLQVFQTTTRVFLRHIEEVLSEISLTTFNSREAILQACNETGRFNGASNIDKSTQESTEPFTPCRSDAVSQSSESWCAFNCELCSLKLCKSTLSYIVDIGSQFLSTQLSPKYRNFLNSIGGNGNVVCVNIFHTFLLNRRPMLRETLEKMTSEDQQVIFSTSSGSPLDVQSRIL